MDIASVIRYRLDELGIEQRDLAAAAEVTESYISQLLAKKKTPPAPDRTEIYEKIAKALKLSSKELSRLADTQRREEAKRKVLDPPRALFAEMRELVLHRCIATKKKQISSIFEREAFGEVERFVTEKLLDVAKEVAKGELEDGNWIHRVAEVSKRSYEQTRSLIFEALEADVFSDVSVENCTSLLGLLIRSWDIEMGSFSMEIVLNRRLTRSYVRKLEFRRVESECTSEREPALDEFLNDAKLSADITADEAAFLKRLRCEGKRPSVLYYYRELQNLRDPLNFLPLSIGKSEGRESAGGRRGRKNMPPSRSGRVN